MSRIEEVKLEGNFIEKLPRVMFAAHLNRDSLSRDIDQETMLNIDFFVYYITSNLYAVIQRGLAKDNETVEKIEKEIQKGLSDIAQVQLMLSKKGKENEK